MLPVPSQVIEILNSGHVLCIKDDKNITYWRFQDNKLQNKVKHKSGETDWMDIKFLILPIYTLATLSGEKNGSLIKSVRLILVMICGLLRLMLMTLY